MRILDISYNVITMERMSHIHPAMKKRLCLFLLWLVSKKEMHGYQMIKLLQKEGMKTGPNRLYPVLNAMLSEGLLSQKEKREGGRVRKAYVITAKGKKELVAGRKLFTGLVGKFIREMLP